MAWRNDQVSEKETEKILAIARSRLGVDGDFVEFGCYKGDTSLLVAEILWRTGKKLWIYDSFEGLPEKNEADESAMGEAFQAGELYVTKRMVKERFLRANLPVPIIKKAWFNELTDGDVPSKIAFAFLDGDFYSSIRDSLRLIDGKMTEGAVIIVHDYENPALPGVVKAVEEWKKGKNVSLEVYQSMAIITM